MSPDYTSIASTVRDGLTKAGVVMTLRKVVEGAYDPDTGVFAVGTTTDYSVIGLIQARSLYQTGAVGQNFFNGVLVQTDDKFIILSAIIGGIIPVAGDQLIISGIVYSVITEIPVEPGGTVIMHRILARK